MRNVNKVLSAVFSAAKWRCYVLEMIVKEGHFFFLSVNELADIMMSEALEPKVFC